MEELYDRIAAYLRAQRRTVEVRRPVREALPRELEMLSRPAPRCQVCGCLVDDDGGLFNLQDMQLRRQCAEHYCPF